MSSRKYISPTIPEDFIPCDWNEGDNLVETNNLIVDKYIRDDIEKNLLEMSKNILDIPEKQFIKLIGGSDSAILHVLSFASSHGYEYFKMRDNDYAQVKAFAETSKMKIQIVPNDQIFKNIEPKSVVYISNPCNPSCELIPSNVIVDICNKNPNSLFLLDSAYIEFHPEYDSHNLYKLNNLINFRTFSKFWGFSGARLGAIIYNESNPISQSLSVLNSKHISILHKKVIENIFKNKNLYIEKRNDEKLQLLKIAKLVSEKFEASYDIAGNFARFDCKSELAKKELISFFNDKKIAIRDLGHLPDYKNTVRFSFRKKAAKSLGIIS